MVSHLAINVSSRLIRHQTDQSPLYQPQQGTLQTHNRCSIQRRILFFRVYSPKHCTRTETRTRVSGVKSRRDNHLHTYGLLVFKVHHDSELRASPREPERGDWAIHVFCNEPSVAIGRSLQSLCWFLKSTMTLLLNYHSCFTDISWSPTGTSLRSRQMEHHQSMP